MSNPDVLLGVETEVTTEEGGVVTQQRNTFFSMNAPPAAQLTDTIRRAVVFSELSSSRSMPLAHHLHFHSNKLLALSSKTKSSTKYPVSKGLKSKKQI